MPSRCCVSKARLPAVGVRADAEEGLRREQLSELGLRELRNRARHAGVEEERLEECLDSADCTAAVIDLLLATQRVAAPTGSAARAAELDSLSLRELRARARLVGVDEEKLEDCLEKEDQRGEIIALLLAHDVPAAEPNALQEELSGLRVTALVKRATSAGVAQEQIAGAMDGGQPKQQLIGLLLAHEGAVARSAELELQERRKQLVGLPTAALHQRALTAGLAEKQIDDAMDKHDPKAALIELLLAAGAAAAPTGSSGGGTTKPGLGILEAGGAQPNPVPRDIPHFGASPPHPEQPAPSTSSIAPPHVTTPKPARHVMLSYVSVRMFQKPTVAHG